MLKRLLLILMISLTLLACPESIVDSSIPIIHPRELPSPPILDDIISKPKTGKPASSCRAPSGESLCHE